MLDLLDRLANLDLLEIQVNLDLQVCPVNLDYLVKLVKKVLLVHQDPRANPDRLVLQGYQDFQVKEDFQDCR